MAPEDTSRLKVRVITIAVGGATCSGKTTLAKHLRNSLYESFIVHQDDFAPPQEKVPVHPKYNVQDWDDAPGAIDWTRLADSLKEVKYTGALPKSHTSHDHLNENREVPVSDALISAWRQETKRITEEHQKKYGEKLIWVLVDGFLMYWDQKVIDQLDIRVFLRVPHDVLKQRRHERHGYHTAEGSLWRDPPHYWEQIVYPAYVKAHSHLFEGGDVEAGKLTQEVPGIILFEGKQLDMQEMLTKVMEKVLAVSRS